MRMAEGGWAGARILMLSPTPTHPLDFGNRRRIWHVGRALMAEGASIHFVHYPAEVDWRSDLPAEAQAAMQRDWASLFTVPVTRPLHMAPQGSHHTVDEWWDPAIGQMLDWLFATQRFDALLVNYTWLSRAFLHAPRSVLKILDTHDRFAGRKELLERHGIAPEFFYMTEAEERVALERADIVWAIKGEERDAFAALAARPAITVPHAEPMHPLPPRAPGSILRFGMVGARNALNLANLTEFLRTARAHVERSLLPCEFHVAGSCCEDLAGLGWPGWVHFHGRVPSLDGFYRSMDAVLVPMRFSTGLKIRVGEALGLGKAVIALGHAFEGYQPCHSFHALPDMGALLQACETLVAEPARLAGLEQASAQAGILAARSAQAGLAATARLGAVLRHALLVVIDGAELHDRSLVLDHVCEATDYLANLAPINLLIIGDRLASTDPEIGWRLRRATTIHCAPTLRSQEAALRRMFGALPPEQPLDRFAAAHPVLWLASPLPEGMLRHGGLAVVPASAWASRIHDPAALDAAVAAMAARVAEAWVVAPCDTPVLAALRQRPNVRTSRVRSFVRHHHAWMVRRLAETAPGRVVVLADAVQDPAARLATEIARQLSGADPALMLPGSAWPGDAPALVLDCGTGPGHDLLREAIDAAGTPRLALFREAGTPAPAAPWTGHGIWESVRRIAAAWADLPALRQAAQRRAEANLASNDAGWALVWDRMTRARRDSLAAAARAG